MDLYRRIFPSKKKGTLWVGVMGYPAGDVNGLFHPYITHTIHGTGIFTYMNGGFLWQM